MALAYGAFWYQKLPNLLICYVNRVEKLTIYVLRFVFIV